MNRGIAYSPPENALAQILARLTQPGEPLVIAELLELRRKETS